MRFGLVLSFSAHAILIGLGFISLSSAKPHIAEEIESIAVDLVPIEEFSNIRVGSEQSEIITTESPSAVDTEQEAIIGERTGSTEEDQPNPQETNIPTPAPTIQTAPTPQTNPVDEPIKETEPELAATIDSQTENIEPILSSEIEQQNEPEEVAPQPVMKTASLEQKREKYRQEQIAKQKQREKEKRQEELAKKREQEAAQEAAKISDIINKEESRGATTGTGGQASAGKPRGQAARLTRSERDALASAMRKCWNPPYSALLEEGLTVRLLVQLNRDGSVAGTPRILSQINSTVEQAMARAAQRAVLRCSPYKLSAQKYEDWKQVDVTFDPRDL